MVSEFDELFVDREELNKELLREVLLPNAKLTSDGGILFEKDDLQQDKKIVIYLLGNKVMKLKGIKQDEAEGPATISNNTGIPHGTVKRVVRELDSKGLLKRMGSGKYLVPDYMLRKIKNWIGN